MTMKLDRFYDLEVEYANALSDRAIQAMSQLSVPATPNNYTVWFNYVIGTSPSLKKTIDILLANKRTFDATLNHDLFVTYASGELGGFTIGDVPQHLHGVINSAKQFLTEAIADNRTHIHALGEVSAQFEASRDPGPVIEKLISALSFAARQAAAMEASFKQTSQELENIRGALSEAEQRSKTDALTGLANRRSLEEYLRSAQIAAMETDEPLSVFMIDVDHFKQFNDRHGHQTGDQVLRLVAKVLQDGVREGGLAARYGGEELMAVLPGVDLNVCKGFAERIRTRISQAKLTRRATGQDIGQITVSIGLSQFRLGETAEAMIERCDRGLYKAKRSGRNRTITEADLDEFFDS